MVAIRPCLVRSPACQTELWAGPWYDISNNKITALNTRHCARHEYIPFHPVHRLKHLFFFPDGRGHPQDISQTNFEPCVVG